MTNRWIIVLTAPDGTRSAWGSWRDANTADHLADKLRDHVGNNEDASDDYAVSIEHVDRWPGLKRAIAELS